MADNPFELDKKKSGPARANMAREWTPEEQAEKLKNYRELDADFWPMIKQNCHVRYYDKTVGFKPGAFIARNPVDIVPTGETAVRRSFEFQSCFNPKQPGYMRWTVAYENVERLFVKPEPQVLQLEKDQQKIVTALNNNIMKLAAHAKKLEQRIAELERKQ